MAFSDECSEVCNRLVFEAFNDNSVSKLQLAKRFYSPTQMLTSLAQCNEKGETPLVIAMQRKNVYVINELVTWISRKDVYKNKECEPIVLIIIDQLAHNIPIMELIDYRISGVHHNTQESTKWLKFIAQFFIKSTSFTRQDKIFLLELVGAALIINLRYANFAEESVCGLECWREAMTLRYCPAIGQPLLPKLPFVYVPSVSSSVVFGSAVEVTTMEELDLLQEDFDRNYLSLDVDIRLPCVRRMQIQALLVIRRISSQANLGHPHWLYLKSLLDFAEVLETAQTPERKRIINTYLLILEEINGFDLKFLSRKSFDIFLLSLEFMSFNCRVALLESPGSPGREELNYNNLLVPSKFFSKIAKLLSNNFAFGDFADTVYRFLFVVGSISTKMTNQEQLNLEKCFYDYIRDTPERTTTVLHVAVSEDWFDEDRHFDIIQLILKLGADPNAIDDSGQTPLHILAGMDDEISLLDDYVLVFQTLVDAGTHLDTASDEGETVLSMLKTNVMRYNHLGMIIDPYFESLINTVFPLSCYAARVIRRHGIRFDEDRLPLHLQTFVKRHSTIDLIDRS